MALTFGDRDNFCQLKGFEAFRSFFARLKGQGTFAQLDIGGVWRRDKGRPQELHYYHC